MALHIFPPFRSAVSRVWLRRVALRALDVACPGRPGQLSVTLADDDTVRGLNRQYRGLDEATDVLAFSPEHPGHWEGDSPPPSARGEPFVLPPGEPEPLGEVVLSVPQAERQARATGHPLERELALLVAHGVLHLAGYDHLEPAQAAAMQAKEQEVLAGLQSNEKE